MTADGEDPHAGAPTPRWRVAGLPVREDEVVWLLTEVGEVIVATRADHADEDALVVVSAGHLEWTAAHFSGEPIGSSGAWSGRGLAPAHIDETSFEGEHRRTAVVRFPELATRMDADVGRHITRVRPRVDVVIEDPDTAQAVGELASAVRERGGRAVLVGGAVRDALWDELRGGRTRAKDVDIEVFGVAAADLHELVLSAHPDTKLVGADFGVLTIERLAMDVSLPRRERKSGVGHRDFVIDADSTMTPEEAAARRDFTINAVSWDPLSGEVIDPVGGAADLAGRLLRHVGNQFAEDPLRVLRGAQLLARFDLVADPATEAMCRSLLPEAAELPRERVWDEVAKLLLKGARPGAGLWFLERVGWSEVVSPHLAALRGVPQDPAWHPEGDVFTHTAHVLDFWSEHLRTGDPYEDLVVSLAALAHDFGKATTTEFADGRWRSHSHDKAGVEPSRQWLSDAQFSEVRGIRRSRLVDDVAVLVEVHLAPAILHKNPPGDRAIRRLANKVGRIDRLVRLAHADQGGRPPLDNREFPAGEWLLERAAALRVVDTPPTPILRGQDLIDHLGWTPGPGFRAVLDTVFEAQLDGSVTSHQEALDLARTL